MRVSLVGKTSQDFSSSALFSCHEVWFAHVRSVVNNISRYQTPIDSSTLWRYVTIKATGCSPWLRMAAIAKSEASHSTVNGSFSSIHFRHALRSSLRKLSNAVTASLWRGKCIFPAVRGFIFREITYPPGVVRKHPKTTFQLFQRHSYWEFYKRT